MFDLNQEILQWRNNLALADILAGSDIDELESHLREEFDQLTALKLSDEEAFLVATHRLGSADGLEAEYEKINRGVKFRNRLLWIVTGVLGYFLAHYLIGTVSVALAVGRDTVRFSPGIVIIILRMLFWSMVVFLCYLVYKGNLDKLRIRQRLSSFKGKCVFIAVLVLAIILLCHVILFIAAEISSSFLITDMIIDSFDLEELEIVWGCMQLVWSVMVPALSVTLLIKLRRSNSYKVDVSE